MTLVRWSDPFGEFAHLRIVSIGSSWMRTGRLDG